MTIRERIWMTVPAALAIVVGGCQRRDVAPPLPVAVQVATLGARVVLIGNPLQRHRARAAPGRTIVQDSRDGRPAPAGVGIGRQAPRRAGRGRGAGRSESPPGPAGRRRLQAQARSGPRAPGPGRSQEAGGHRQRSPRFGPTTSGSRPSANGSRSPSRPTTTYWPAKTPARRSWKPHAAKSVRASVGPPAGPGRPGQLLPLSAHPAGDHFPEVRRGKRAGPGGPAGHPDHGSLHDASGPSACPTRRSISSSSASPWSSWPTRCAARSSRAGSPRSSRPPTSRRGPSRSK